MNWQAISAVVAGLSVVSGLVVYEVNNVRTLQQKATYFETKLTAVVNTLTIVNSDRDRIVEQLLRIDQDVTKLRDRISRVEGVVGDAPAPAPEVRGHASHTL